MTNKTEIGTCKEIPINQGKHVLVDQEDFEWLSQWKWSLTSHGYACRSTTIGGIKNSYYMHREILKTQKGYDTDHINGDRLDNRRCNLRICTRSQNMLNVLGNKNTTSKYKGVDWHKSTGMWRIRIMVDGKRINLGYSHSEDDAARIYNAAAVTHHGKFAKLNEV